MKTQRWLPNRAVVVVADASFAALELIAAVRRHVCLTTRLRADANLLGAPAWPAPPARAAGQTPAQARRRIEDLKTAWNRVTPREWYGGQTHEVEHVSGVAIGYKDGFPPATIRWILVRDPTGEREPTVFLYGYERRTRGDLAPIRLPLADRDHVWAHKLATARARAVRPRAAAWYDMTQPTFSDAIAAVRRFAGSLSSNAL